MNQIPSYNPQVLKRTASGVEKYDIRDRMLADRQLELTCQVDAESCSSVIRGLLYLQGLDAQAPVTLYINSLGGEVQ